MNKYLLQVIAIVLAIAGVALLFAKTDRQFISLAPTDGVRYATVLTYESTYELSFPAQSSSLTRLDLQFRTLTRDVPTDPITITIRQNDLVLNQQELNPNSIENDQATQIRFTEPLQLQPGQYIHIVITVPSALSRKVALQTRAQEEGLYSDSTFLIDGKAQVNPAAYEAFHLYRPPIAWQIGLFLLFIATSILLHLYTDISKHASISMFAIVLGGMLVVPNLLAGDVSVLILLFSQAVAFLGMFYFLQYRGLSFITAVFGGIIFACTTWFALQYTAGRYTYLLLAFLPWAFLSFMAKKKALPSTAHRSLQIISLLALATVIITALREPSLPYTATAREVFFDPYQVLNAEKVFTSENQPINWSNFGAYIGFPAAFFALLGILRKGAQESKILLLMLGAAVLSFFPAAARFIDTLLHIPAAHFIILAVFGIAYFAAWGLYWLEKYLGKEDQLVRVLITAIAVLTLFDLLHVATITLEHPFLP